MEVSMATASSGIHIHSLGRLTTGNNLDCLNHTRHTRHAIHKDDFINVGGFNTRICQSLLAGIDGTLDERSSK